MRQVEAWSKWLSVLVALAGALALLGWALRVPALESLAVGTTPVGPSTAWCFVLSGLGAYLLVGSPAPARPVPFLLGALLAVLGAAALGHALGAVEIPPDAWLFPHRQAAPGTPSGPMAPITALCWMLLGLALAGAGTRDASFAARPLAVAVLLIVMVALIGHVYGFSPFYRLPGYAPMGVRTALVLALVSVVVIALRPTEGFTAVLLSPSGLLTRRLLPAVLVVPPLLGWLRLKGELAGWYGSAFGLSLFTLANMGIFGVLLLASTKALHRAAERRRETEEHFRRTFEQAAVGIAHVSPQRLLLRVNGRLCEMLGYRREELVGRSQTELLHPQDREDTVQREQALFGSEGPSAFSVERRYLRKDGSTMWGMATVSAAGGERQDYSIEVVEDITERKRTEREVTMFKSFSDQSSESQLLLDCDARILYANRTACERLGYSTQELFSMSISDIHPSFPRERFDRLLEASGRGPLPPFETRQRCKDGTLVPVEVSVTTLDLEGQRFMLATSRDIAQRKEYERRLRESEERWRTLADNIAQLVWVADANGVIRWYNRRWLDYTALPAASRLSLARLIRPDHRRRVAEKFRARFVAGEPWEDMFPLRAVDGSYRWFLSQALPLRDEQGRIVRWFGTSTDVTEQRRAQQDLAKFKFFSDNSADALFIRDAEGRFLYVNRQACASLGYGEAELLRLRVKDIDASYRDRAPKDSGAGVQERSESLHRRKDGSLFPVEIATTTLDIQGERLSFAAARDITDRKRAEAALREADARKDEFLAMLAHELRNPLAPLSNAVVLMRRLPPEAPAMKQLWPMMDRQIRHLTRLVEDLLDVSRITRGKVTLQKQPMELQSLVARAIETATPALEARGHQLVTRLPAHPIWIEADELRLVQVIANLLNNAAKYTNPGGQVALGADLQGGEVAIRIQDNGIGIDRSLLPHVFDLFRQGERTPARDPGGLGIGLTLVQRLVQMHGGSVRADSAGLGKGSIFEVRLPVSRAAGAQAAEAPGIRAVGRPLRLLVVDDNRDVADSLALLLRTADHEVDVAYDGPGALGIAQEKGHDAVFMDIGMPGMDGYELARRLRSMPEARRPILVAVSGYGPAGRDEAADFDHHLQKPVDPARLRQVLDVVASAPV